MVDPTQWVVGMRRAIEAEMADRRRPGRSERLLLGRGQRASHLTPGPEYVYVFEVPEHGRIPALLGGELRTSEGRVLPARIVSWPARGPLSVTVQEDLGGFVEGSELHYPDDGVLRVLHQRLEDSAEVLEDRIRAFYGRSGQERLGPITTPQADVLIGLNGLQAQAVQEALGASLSRIWGPPGTGKTMTAAALARAWIDQGRTVILSGPTNRSVDLLLSAVLGRLEWKPTEMEGRVLRLGPLTDRELSAQWGNVVELGAVLERQKRQAREDLEAVREKIAEIDLAGMEPAGETPHDDSPVSGLFKRRRFLESQVDLTRRDLLERAQVIAATAHRVAIGQVPSRDAMILDEASMVGLPVGLLATMAASQTTLVGDPCQLGPVVQSRAHIARVWLGTSIFGGQGSDVSAPTPRGPTTLLRSQHRMPPAVCNLVSELSYHGRLRTAKAHRTSGGLFHLNVADVLCGRPESPEGRHENRAQAKVVLAIAAGFLGRPPQVHGDIALISPYRSHVRALRNEVVDRGLAAVLKVSTVHRAQGRQHAVVVLSLPERPGEPLSPFLRAARPSDDGARLLTVAISRASERLVVVGDLSWLARAAPKGGILDRFLRLLKTHGAPVEVPGRTPTMSEDSSV